MKKTGLIVIGDEILSGKIKDENSFVFTSVMFERGVKVERIEVIPDQLEAIADTVKRFSSLYDYVCTSGGVGPTHDDRTLEGISLAFRKPLIEHQEAFRYFQLAQEKAGRGSVVSDAQRKMLAFPKGSKVYFVEPLWLPLIQLRNVYIFPGVPFLFERLLKHNSYLFDGSQFFRELIATDKSESTIAHDLSTIQDQFNEVQIGSYPQSPQKDFRVLVSVEGENKDQVLTVANLLLSVLDGRRVLYY
ncbi:MAG: competence/damage-inducible protein A [Myxococcales bacterium]|nr:competence/damage-inducible protein A [Myxococcales bacterium]USN50497.1 MAG: competence/damage-inducible protein A [Myxococcales bacterium]